MFTYFFGFFSGIIAYTVIIFVILFTLYVARKDYRMAMNRFFLTWRIKYKKWKSDKSLRKTYKIKLGEWK
jgi:membrane-associated protease RseP (regulator of RpoE activity)